MSKVTLKTLLARAEALEKQIQSQKAQEKAQVIQQIKSLMDNHGLRLHDIGSVLEKRPHPSRGMAVPVKYKDPQSGATWTGRGKTPMWIKDKDRSNFVV